MQYKDGKNLLSEIKFLEGYSRKENGIQETWPMAVNRIMNMHREFYKDKMTPELENIINEIEFAYRNKVFLGSQRALQFGGEQLLKHHARLYNCVSSVVDRPAFFGEIFYWLLAGAGAGFAVYKKYTENLPRLLPRTKSPKLHQIEDSIEGWATSLDVLLSSFFEHGGKHPEYAQRKIYFDFTKIREEGSDISGGFKAPGPDPLRNALNKIENILISVSEQKRKMKPIEIYDIIMHASDAVLSGGVRRSATICIFDANDDDMINAKTGNWYVENPQRARSNNSAAILKEETSYEVFEKIFEKNKQYGEPGFIFVDDLETTYNPCVEVGMHPFYYDEIELNQIIKMSGWQGCNLTEINGSYCDSLEKFEYACYVASAMGTLQAGYTNFKFVDEITRKIFEREALLGVSITGWMSNPDVLFKEENLQRGAEIVKSTNEKVAKLIGINKAARTTCTKPSGNASVILGTPSGIHGEHSKYYIRNIQINKNTQIAKTLKEISPYLIEDSVWSANKTDYVVSIPVVSKQKSIFKKDLYGVKLLEYVKLVQQNWVEYGTNIENCVSKTVRHNVSNTIQVDNWDDVKEYIWKNKKYFAGISLLPLSGDKDYNQAPFSEILSYEEIQKKYGIPALFASGLIVDALKSFDNNLWLAIDTAKGIGLDISEETDYNLLKRDWVRRFRKFSDFYYSGDIKLTEYCLKDVYLVHKWTKIQIALDENKIIDSLTSIQIEEKDINTMGAAACFAGQCEI